LKKPAIVKVCPRCGGDLAAEYPTVVHRYVNPKTGRFWKREMVDPLDGSIVYCLGRTTTSVFGVERHGGCGTVDELYIKGGRVYAEPTSTKEETNA
jgi:hypothetical protein